MPFWAYAALHVSWSKGPLERDCRAAPRSFSKAPKPREISCAGIFAPVTRFCSRAREGCRWKRRWTAPLRAWHSPMLYWLLYEQLYPAVGPFRVFRYVTSRTLFASLTSLFLCIMLG